MLPSGTRLHSRHPAFLLLGAWALLCSRAVGSLFQNRYGVNDCTLTQELEQLCQFKSYLGSNSSFGSFNGLYMFPGETNCTVVIPQCRKNTCYSWRDLTQLLPSDAGIAGTNGFFRSVEIISGAKDATLTREGFSFRTTAQKVVLMYSTALCGDFYRVHGRIGQQLCNQPIEAVTEIGTSLPTSLRCPSSS